MADESTRGDDQESRLAEAQAAIDESRRRLAEVPAELVVTNHAMGLYELAAIHLSQQPPNLPEAGVAVDALAALVNALEGRLGENEATLNQALTQLQMAFVELSRRLAGEGDAPGGAG